MNCTYNLKLCFAEGQAKLRLTNHSSLNRNWFGQFAISIYAKALQMLGVETFNYQLDIKKQQLQTLFLEITTIYQRSLVKHNIEKDLYSLKMPNYLANISQSLLLMLRMNTIHQNYKFLLNFYFEEYRTLNSEAMDQSLAILVSNNIIQKIETNDKQIFFDKNPRPHSHIYFKNQNKLIDCNDDCYHILLDKKHEEIILNNTSSKLFEINY
jgi:hypothetical protein